MSDQARGNRRISGGDFLRMGLLQDAWDAYARDDEEPSTEELIAGVDAILERHDFDLKKLELFGDLSEALEIVSLADAPAVLTVALDRMERRFADRSVELEPAAFRRFLTDQGDFFSAKAKAEPGELTSTFGPLAAMLFYAMAFVWDVKHCGTQFPGWGPETDTEKMFEMVLTLLPMPTAPTE